SVTRSGVVEAEAPRRAVVDERPVDDPAVLIMARAPRRGEVRRALESVLGADGCVALQAELIGQAGCWAGGWGPGAGPVAPRAPGRRARGARPDRRRGFDLPAEWRRHRGPSRRRRRARVRPQPRAADDHLARPAAAAPRARCGGARRPALRL